MQRNERNEFIDLIKGIAIILVVMGHCIQYGSGKDWLQNGMFFDNFLFKNIYSFHMPLFMMISGYLFYFAINKYSFTKNVKKRVMTLLIPIMSWSLIYNLFNALNTSGDILNISFIKQCIWYAIGSFWFLWALFYCSIVVMIANRLFNDNLLVYLVGLILTFIIPDGYNFYLYKFVYPFFIIGYMGNKYGFSIEKIRIKKEYLLLCILVFEGLLLLYSKEVYIYISRYRIVGKEEPIKMLLIDGFRFFMGFLGSVLIIRLVDLIYKVVSSKIVKIIAFIGRNSLGIYIVSGFVFPFVLQPTCANLAGLNYFMMIFQTVLILGSSLLCTILISKIFITNLFLLGGR